MNEKIAELNRINKQIEELENKRKKIKFELKESFKNKDINEMTDEEIEFMCKNPWNDEEVPF